MLESGGTVNYRGSIATFFYSRQAIGTYKCCTTVYGAPTRQFSFDIELPHAGTPAAADAGVPRREHAGLLAGDSAGDVGNAEIKK